MEKKVFGKKSMKKNTRKNTKSIKILWKKSLEKTNISLYEGLPDIILKLPLKSQKNNYKKKFIQKISPRKKYHRKESHENILGYNTR